MSEEDGVLGLIMAQYEQMNDKDIGIVVGIIVYVITVSAVIYLLIAGGSFERIREQAKGTWVPASLAPRAVLYDDLLDARKRLPAKPDGVHLSGKFFELRPVRPSEDAEALYKISNGSAVLGGKPYDADGRIWRYLTMVDPPTSVASLKATLVKAAAAPDQLHFVVLRKDSPADEKEEEEACLAQACAPAAATTVVGMISILHHDPANLNTTIGDWWVTPSLRRRRASAEPVLLLLRHLFALKFRRVQWLPDAEDVVGRGWGAKAGFMFEGVMKKAAIVKDANRDVCVFALLNSDWPVVEAKLEQRLYHTAQSKKKSKLGDGGGGEQQQQQQAPEKAVNQKKNQKKKKKQQQEKQTETTISRSSSISSSSSNGGGKGSGNGGGATAAAPTVHAAAVAAAAAAAGAENEEGGGGGKKKRVRNKKKKQAPEAGAGGEGAAAAAATTDSSSSSKAEEEGGWTTVVGGGRSKNRKNKKADA